MMRYGYHATSRSRLPFIRREGLRGGKRRNRGDGPPMFVWYFADSERAVRDYGEVVLRFPWPEGAVEGRSAGEYNTEATVPPEQIEILRRGSWQPLVTGGLGSLFGRR